MDDTIPGFLDGRLEMAAIWKGFSFFA